MPRPEFKWLLDIDLDPDKGNYKEKFNKLVSFLRGLRISNYPKLKRYAEEYKACMLKLDPAIEHFTSKVCPYCGTVCCKQKFAFPNKEDIILFWSLDIDIPFYDFNRDINGSCQFLSYNGCVLPRLHRPFRCTWYFCEALWLQIEINPLDYNIETGLKQLIFAKEKLINSAIDLITV